MGERMFIHRFVVTTFQSYLTTVSLPSVVSCHSPRPSGGPSLRVIDLVPDTFNRSLNAPDSDEVVSFHLSRFAENSSSAVAISSTVYGFPSVDFEMIISLEPSLELYVRRKIGSQPVSSFQRNPEYAPSK